MGGPQSNGEARGKVPSKKNFKDVATISNKGRVGKVVHFAPPKLLSPQDWSSIEFQTQEWEKIHPLLENNIARNINTWVYVLPMFNSGESSSFLNPWETSIVMWLLLIMWRTLVGQPHQKKVVMTYQGNGLKI